MPSINNYISIIVLTSFIIWINFDVTTGGIENMFNLKYWNCYLKKSYSCPDNDLRFYLYTEDTKDLSKRIDIRSKIALRTAGWNPDKNNVIIIHGFNGTHKSPALKLLRNAFLEKRDYNVFMVNWHSVARFPCYLSALSNMRLVSQCIAQLYAHMMEMGGHARKTTCIGHSLGAHVCGMISNYLDLKQYKIVGLDPARPLIDQFANPKFRLTRDDAHHVQIIHTNAGLLGETGVVGHVDFCVNGGTVQPGCKGHIIKRSRCSHFQSVCYYAAAIRNNLPFHGRPCTPACPRKPSVGILPGRAIPMGPDVPLNASGQYCIRVNHDNDCAFN